MQRSKSEVEMLCDVLRICDRWTPTEFGRRCFWIWPHLTVNRLFRSFVPDALILVKYNLSEGYNQRSIRLLFFTGCVVAIMRMYFGWNISNRPDSLYPDCVPQTFTVQPNSFAAILNFSQFNIISRHILCGLWKCLVFIFRQYVFIFLLSRIADSFDRSGWNAEQVNNYVTRKPISILKL